MLITLIENENKNEFSFRTKIVNSEFSDEKY